MDLIAGIECLANTGGLSLETLSIFQLQVSPDGYYYLSQFGTIVLLIVLCLQMKQQAGTNSDGAEDCSQVPYKGASHLVILRLITGS